MYDIGVTRVQNMCEYVWGVTMFTCHICGGRIMFSSYKNVKDEEQIYMINSLISHMVRKWMINLKLTSRRILILTDILHVSDIRKNLIFGVLLYKVGVKLIFESSKIILIRNGVFVGKWYCSGNLYVLHVAMNEVASSFAYSVDYFDVWHEILGHTNISYLKMMKNLGLIMK